MLVYANGKSADRLREIAGKRFSAVQIEDVSGLTVHFSTSHF
jgi:hypothetical protein